MVTRHEVIIKKEMSNVATQIDDSGCVHGCTSMYVSPLGNFNVSNSNSCFNLHLDSYNDELAESEVPFMTNADKKRESKPKCFFNNISVGKEATFSRANNEDLSSSKESGFFNNISVGKEATISGANNEDLSLSRDSSNDVEGETIKTNSDSFISSGKAASNPSSDNTMDRETTIVTSQSSSQRRITLSARVLLRPLIILPEINSKEHKPTLDYEEKAYLCDKCPKAFDKRSTLLRHILVHTGERPHSCRQCGKSFSDKGNLNQHLKVHSGNKPYKCKHCKRSFSRSPDLTRHLRIHTGQKPYKCEECGKAFTQIGTLKQHGQVHSGKKPFKCQECNKSFTLKSNLVVHQRTHTGEKPFECRRCGNMFSQKVTLREHQRLAHNRKKEFKCSSCRREFSTKRKFTYHHTYHSN
ncbi:zinc finger protein 23 isoform X2 [Exaiptasia diaphana]|nr:zinc finger protein 23 isoform X2 [Exaiptasia diaphana]